MTFVRWTGRSAPGIRLFASLLLLAGAGCHHADQFDLGPQDPQGPRSTDAVRQVTFGGPDFTPAVSASGTSWLYASGFRPTPVVNDWCIAGLPLAGGGQTRTYCDVSLGRPSVTSDLRWPAEFGDGRLAFMRLRGFPNGGATFDGSLVLGSFQPRDSGVVLRHFPYNTASGTAYSVSHLARLDGHTLIFVTTNISHPGMRSEDTLVTGLQIERLDIDHPPATPDVFPGTELATSVDPAPDGGSFYYTVEGDPHLLRRTIATGVTDTLHDFGPDLVRDVRAAGDSLYAVIGGGRTDGPGTLVRVNLPSGTVDTIQVPGLLVRHPVISADHKSILLEGWGPSSRQLWLVEVP